MAGASYLIYLGLKTLRGGLRPIHGEVSPVGAGFAPPFVQGLINNLLNPKCAAIFLSVFPQFVHPGDPPARLALMGGLFALMTFTWLNILGALLARAGRRFGGRLKRTADALAGTVMIGLGLRVAVSR